jgi:hypothetical protein
MASMSDFRRVADDVRNWGRWGDADELGTLNFITTDKVAEAASLVKHGKVFPLGVDFGSSGPQGAFHFRQNPLHVMTIDGGDASTLLEYGPKWLQNPAAGQLAAYFEGNPMRFNDDIIIMPLQAATQWDALSHVYYEDYLYNGFPANSVTSGCVPLRHRQGRRQGHHFTRGTARHSPATRCRHLLRDGQPDHSGRTRRRPSKPRVSPSGRVTSCWSEPVGGQDFWRPATGASRARVWTGRARHGCTTTRRRQAQHVHRQEGALDAGHRVLDHQVVGGDGRTLRTAKREP